MSIATNTTNTATNSLAELNAKLIEASEDGRVEVVRLLIAAGADPATWGNMPLGSASFNGHCEVVKLLLESGADAAAMDDLMDAVDGHDEVAKILADWKEANK